MKNGRRNGTAELRKKAEQRHRKKGLGEATPLYEEAANAMLAEDRGREAAEMLTAALAADGQRSEAASHQQRDLRRLLAHILAQSRDTGAAISEYEEYCKLGTPDAPSLRALAELYVTVGKPNIAIDRLRRAIDRSIAEGDITGAAAAAGRLTDLTPESIEAAVQRVSLLRNIGDENLVPALEHLAALYRSAEKLAQEVACCQEMLELAPGRDDVRKRLTSLYTRILEMDPHDDTAWQGLRKVDPDLADQTGVLLMDELSESRVRSKAG